jgi:hypothetical protein
MNMRIILQIIFIAVINAWEYRHFSPDGYTNRYISKQQWEKIKEILHHPGTTPVMKTQLQHQIYNHYHKWAQYKAYQFKRFHRHKCRSISIQELDIYSQRGLYQAIQKYNGRSRFLPYVNVFVMGELYRGMTELQPITPIPKTIRRKKTILKQKRRRSETQFVGENDWIFDKLPPISSTALSEHPTAHYLKKEEEQKDYRDIWEKVKEWKPITQRIFQMKYGVLLDSEGNGEKGENSNRKIGEKLGYSEEFVRKNILKIKQTFSPPFSPKEMGG